VGFEEDPFETVRDGREKKKVENGACGEAFESVRDGREKKRFRG
jgi:hypothetical protein